MKRNHNKANNNIELKSYKLCTVLGRVQRDQLDLINGLHLGDPYFKINLQTKAQILASSIVSYSTLLFFSFYCLNGLYTCIRVYTHKYRNFFKTYTPYNIVAYLPVHYYFYF